MLRLVLDLEHGITQIRVGQDVKLLRLTSNAGLLRPASEVSVFFGTRLHFSLKSDLRVEVRFTSDDLSLVIFRQPIIFSHLFGNNTLLFNPF